MNYKVDFQAYIHTGVASVIGQERTSRGLV